MRIRSEKRWNTEFTTYESPEHFTSSPVAPGGHTITWRDQPLDLLLINRGSPVTLVTFNGAVSLRIKQYPLFTGLGLAESAGVNLVAVSDPALLSDQLTVGWYLGNQYTGPINDVYAPLVQHALDSLNTRRAILFGVSGGGYAAARMGHHFPGCVTLLVNPRLSLLEYSAVPLATYFEQAHDRTITNPLSAEDLQFLEQYGPGRYRLDPAVRLEHDLLIYQNVIDSKFMGTQVLPFLKKVQNEPRLHVRFEADELGHTPIPTETIQPIVRELSALSPQGEAIRDAGFANKDEAAFNALQQFQPVAGRLSQAHQQQRALEAQVDAQAQTSSVS